MNAPPDDVVARIERLEIAARGIVDGYLAGRHRSPRHGFAVEFAQHREYSPGDDPRHIDWKIFGRTERHHIRQYEQETNLTGWLIVDASESMRYGSTERTKYDTAATAAAALATLILRQSDSAAAVVLAKNVKHWHRPSANPGRLRDLLRILAEGPAAETASFGAALDAIAPRLGRRGILMIFSDFLDDAEPILEAFRHLKFHKHDVIAFQTLDPDEIEFPFRHPTLFRGLEASDSISTDPIEIRTAYLSAFQKHQERLAAGCRELEIEIVLLRTDQDLGRQLAAVLNRRMAR